jgi:N,N'-diacetyllegionaminate synthase
MKIGKADTTKDVCIIAEIGNNHEGDLDLAKSMISLAAKAGAHAVKFQTIQPEYLVSVQDKARIEQLNRFRFTFKQFEGLSKTAKSEGVAFLSTPFDLASATFLNSIVPVFKIASGDNNFYPLIDFLAETGKPIIFSSGLADYKQIKTTRDRIHLIWKKNNITQELAILHCISSYPTLVSQANLMAIPHLKELKCIVGYSDHTLSIEACIVAVSLGARIIEKHFTLDKNHSSFRDHQLSADPKDFADLVKRIHETEALLGTGKFVVDPIQEANAVKLRRSIVARVDLAEGKKITSNDITWVRPGGGIPPGEEKKVVGQTLKKSVRQGEMIKLSDLSS